MVTLDEIQRICIEDYDYPLPESRIAKYPLPERDASQLLLYRQGKLSHSVFRCLPDYLPPGAWLVFNNTRVIQARLHFYKETGGQIEIFCLDPVQPAEYQSAFSARETCVWKCMVGNLKRWKSGVLHKTCTGPYGEFELRAERLSTQGNTHYIQFHWSAPLVFAEVLDALGELPIPPYLNRKSEEADKVRYQTIYSKIKGSVAAPTAGLHFTDAVLEQLNQQGFGRCELTLHVGAGTFQPVQTASIGGHEMHTEFMEVSLEAIKRLRANLGHIIAVGTTAVRTLESLYYIGLQVMKGHTDGFVSQWEPYLNSSDCSAEQALEAVEHYMEVQGWDSLHAHTQIIIAPGYKFRVVRGLITNFHQPKSTLLLLLAAYVGEDWRRIYRYAMEHHFRFLSYGDSSLLLRE